jgi:hypothetical protein
MLSCLRQDNRFNRTVRPEYQVMVIGIPNVGREKSFDCTLKTLLNCREIVASQFDEEFQSGLKSIGCCRRLVLLQKCFLNPDLGYCIEAKMEKIRILTIWL